MLRDNLLGVTRDAGSVPAKQNKMNYFYEVPTPYTLHPLSRFFYMYRISQRARREIGTVVFCFGRYVSIMKMVPMSLACCSSASLLLAT